MRRGNYVGVRRWCAIMSAPASWQPSEQAMVAGYFVKRTLKTSRKSSPASKRRRNKKPSGGRQTKPEGKARSNMEHYTPDSTDARELLAAQERLNRKRQDRKAAKIKTTSTREPGLSENQDFQESHDLQVMQESP